MKITNVDSSISLELTFSRSDILKLGQMIKAMDAAIDTAHEACNGYGANIDLEEVEMAGEGLELLIDILKNCDEEI
tara:strand:+ start:707 stop:934 length:228 start_codon:yes stop_codon:yes gene_type:complete